jgi:tellurium resistance protein TerZ
VDTVYFNKKASNDGAIKHSGDDRGGDSSNDNKDNEVIFIDLKKVNPSVSTIVVYLNSYKGQDFDTIPYANVRLMDGDLPNYKSVIATFNLAGDPKYKGKVSVVMAKIVRTSRGWNFVAIGDPVDAKRIDDTIVEIKNHFL